MKTVPSFSTKAAPVIIDGKAASQAIVEQVKAAVVAEHLRPGLAVLLVGSDPASAVYVRNKGLRAKECGFHSEQIDLDENTSEGELLAVIGRLNSDENIHGILVQLPLPRHIDAHKVIQAIHPMKDVDGFHYVNVGHLASGALGDALVPCTPLGSLHLIQQHLGNDLSGKHAVVIGRSNIVGKPMASLLLQHNCTVTVLHSRTFEPEKLCRQADIVVAAVGVPGLVKADWIKPGALVIDVGINRIELADGNSRLVGDVAFDEVAPLTSAITPVPGGVGPMTIALLMQNTLSVARRFKKVGLTMR
ncbi:bifunctional methylenetetrahydrofolate dehydrogenase/methenyltetrahydrofolate cyclohydrolase FolD [Pseudomonas sp. G2-4]|uniref:bifunctional 5,10-methylenetetrahydrofolate dehydrogenase/5,10-methenyltetrahydrofolate cyclohydrolase n=1 Tax=Pseudomonas sp. G2-4 TaxID=1506334 RepID=UPI0024B96426|nr:bifunctional methylenetetrahydrofolate dehydrogenase/methenyltetrahydrofolate cyclohydrolase FolD [Pseudomonas sp. G2-4]WHS62437.1 bifunctional methylenetetrahydrofolate dehydrogenase/methenyltetrahydrofolate cyclohydrolase FolD [Pseudomonas sp. G2-4]